MIVHINVGVSKENGKWIGRWQTQACTKTSFVCMESTDTGHEVLANRRQELERKLDKALRLAFPKANYIVLHRT